MKTLSAFVAGGVTAFLAIAFAPRLVAQSAATGTIEVCVVGGGALRVTPPAESCDPGQDRLVFFVSGAVATPATTDAAADSEVRELEREATDLEQDGRRGGKSVRTAPFSVENRTGRVVFRVDTNASEGGVVSVPIDGVIAEIYALDDGGFLRSSAGNEEAEVGALGSSGFGLRMGEKDIGNRIELGRGIPYTAAEKYKLVFGAPRVAGIGQSEGGSGLIFVADNQGTMRGRFWRDGAEVLNGNELPIAMLKQGEHGGILRLSNSRGEPMVDAGVEPGNYGVVRAGPAAFRTLPSMLGLPGSYIMGKPQ